MAVVLRLRRMGCTNKPFYRIIAADERTPSNGRFLENLGWYDPKQKTNRFEVKLERLEHWKRVGARMTESVASLYKKAKKMKPTVVAREEVDATEEPVAKTIEATEITTETATGEAQQENASLL